MDENNKKARKNKRRNKKNKRALEAWEVVMSNFTDDLWIEIFLRLPFKSLLRIKSVSKSWFSIISSHHFALSHLAITPIDDQVVIVHNELNDYEEEEEDGSFSLFHLDSGSILRNLKFPFSQGEYPFEPYSSTLIGSDYGIVCVCVSVSNWPAAKNEFDIYLWNPATKHSKLLPPYTLPDNNIMLYGHLGFGFDQIDLDFKVVRVVSDNSAEVYSTSMNKWRKMQSKPGSLSDFHVCLHGFLLTIGYETGMTAFNLNKEVFICDINLPVNSFDDTSFVDTGGSYTDTRVTEFKDTIAVIISTMYNGRINLWTLDDEECLCCGGVEASWTKVQSVDIGVSSEYFEVLCNNVQYLLIEKDGDRFLYNFDEKVITNIPSRPYLESCEFFKYTRSLFSLVGFKRIKWAASSPRLQNSSDSNSEID